jgi:hypothetical protein
MVVKVTAARRGKPPGRQTYTYVFGIRAVRGRMYRYLMRQYKIGDVLSFLFATLGLIYNQKKSGSEKVWILQGRRFVKSTPMKPPAAVLSS